METKSNSSFRLKFSSDISDNFLSLDSDSQAERGNFFDGEGTIIEKYFNSKLKLLLGINKKEKKKKKIASKKKK